MKDYKSRMVEALERTDKWGLRCRGSVMMNAYLHQDLGDMPQPPASALAKISRQIPIPPQMRAGDCAGIHVGAATQMLERGFPFQPVLTIGDVLIDGRARYGVTRQGLRRMLRKGPESTDTIDIHVWLTWPDLTIFDLTLLPAMLHEAGDALDLERPDGLALIGRSDELAPDRTYVPTLVGDAFLWRIGAINSFGQQRFERAQLSWIEGLGPAPRP